jgi:Peptidase family M28
MGIENGRTSRRAVLGASAAVAGAAVLHPAAASAATTESVTGPGSPARGQRPDRELRRLLEQIDRNRMEATVRALVAFGTRHTLSTQDDPARGIGAARDWLLARFQEIAATSGGRMTVELQSFIQPVASRIPVPTRISNIIATLHGDAEPARMHVISAHYDSRVTDVLNGTDDAPGADDDGSGIAVVLELARLFATRHVESTIVFTAVAGEEQGLYGSAFQAQQYKAAGAQVAAMFSNDIVGSSTAEDGTRDRRTVRLFADGVPPTETPAQASTRQSVGGENDSPARQLSRFAKSVAENDDTGMRIRSINRRDRYLRGSDHISYLQQGYPGLRFTEPAEDFAHQHQDVRVDATGKQFGDLPEFCDFGYMAGVARVNAAVLWSLAQAPAVPVNPRIDASQLTNSTTLLWQPSTAPDIAGYEVVWRETTAPDWTNVIPVGNVTTATIQLSKDNVFFGVRAVDADGHRSPVAFPLPSA